MTDMIQEFAAADAASVAETAAQAKKSFYPKHVVH